MRADRRRAKPLASAALAPVGVLVALLAALLGGASALPAIEIDAAASADLTPADRRLLVVALDAVPFHTVEQALAEAEASGHPLFAGMSSPTPVISSFPSTTTLAFTGMFEALGLATPPGYEARFFDLERGKVRGGGPVSYRKIDFSWRDFFDFKIKGAVRKGVGYARPIRFAGREIRKGLRSFLASDRPVFFLYMSATDGVAHLKGPDAIIGILRELDEALKVARGQEDFYTVLLSDHGVGGGDPLFNVRKDVKRTLREGGFRVKKRLRSERDLVLVPFGLLSSFVAFVEPGHEARATELLGSVEGVALCASPSGEDRWALAGTEGVGALERRVTPDLAGQPSADVVGVASNGHGDVVRGAGSEESPGSNGHGRSSTTWRYLPEEGDPLAASGLAGEWIPDEVWLAEAEEARFPDAPHRIARAFDLVTNPASVVCSLEPDFMFGSALTERSGRMTVGKLRWTHGSLERHDSLGFLLTDLPNWKSPSVLRFDHTIQALARK